MCIWFYIQVDIATINEMSDEQLRGSPFSLKYGDITALRVFLRTQHHASPSALRTNRQSLLERLRDRIAEQGGSKKRTRMMCNKFAKKATRRLELGWLHFDCKLKHYCQVRPNKGGGVRHLVVAASSVKDDLMVAAREMFFPNGVSPKGLVDEFQMTILHVDESEIDSHEDVSSMYSRRCVPLLRLYLATKGLDVTDEQEVSL